MSNQCGSTSESISPPATNEAVTIQDKSLIDWFPWENPQTDVIQRTIWDEIDGFDGFDLFCENKSSLFD
jgi:hypothetical protein